MIFGNTVSGIKRSIYRIFPVELFFSWYWYVGILYTTTILLRLYYRMNPTRCLASRASLLSEFGGFNFAT